MSWLMKLCLCAGNGVRYASAMHKRPIISNLSQTNDALTAYLSHTYHALNFVQSYEKFLDFARKNGDFLSKEYYYIYIVYIV